VGGGRRPSGFAPAAGARSVGVTGKRFALDRPGAALAGDAPGARAHRQGPADPAVDGRSAPRLDRHVRGPHAAAHETRRSWAARRGHRAQRGGRGGARRARLAWKTSCTRSAASASSIAPARPAQDLTRSCKRRCRSTRGATRRRRRAARATPSSRCSWCTRGPRAATSSCATGKYGVPALVARGARPHHGRAVGRAPLGARRPERFAALAAAALGGDIRRDVMLRPRVGPGARRRAPCDRAAPRRRSCSVGQGGGCAGRTRSCRSTCSRSSTCRPKAPAIFHGRRRRARRAPGWRHPPHRAPPRDQPAARGQPRRRGAPAPPAGRRDWWLRARDPVAILRDLALLDGKLDATRALAQGGELGPLALAAGRHSRWRAEALRHAGKLDDARKAKPRTARRLFHALDDRAKTRRTRCACSATSRATWAPRPRGGAFVTRALATFEERAHVHGAALCRVVTLGEIDYLIGEHARARQVLSDAASRLRVTWATGSGARSASSCRASSSRRGGAPSHAYALLAEARAECRRHRLPARHRPVRSGARRTRSTARVSSTRRSTRSRSRRGSRFRDLATPRGEAGCDRLLAMCYLDRHDSERAEVHARASGALFDRLADPWGQVEAGLLLAQVALSRDDTEAARGEVIACEAVALSEAEPKSAPPPDPRLAGATVRGAPKTRRARSISRARRLQGREPHRRSHAGALGPPREARDAEGAPAADRGLAADHRRGLRRLSGSRLTSWVPSSGAPGGGRALCHTRAND
jgi:hypothetical protein